MDVKSELADSGKWEEGKSMAFEMFDRCAGKKEVIGRGESRWRIRRRES